MSRKRIKVSLIFFVLTAFSGPALWLVKTPSIQGRSPSVAQDTQSGDPVVELNRKAKAAKGLDAIAVYDVTSEVINTFAPTEVPAFTQEAMKERVGRAELNYRKGVNGGISEVKVAKVVNELADKLALPDYAKVSVAMVRTARVLLMLQLPNLVGQDHPAIKTHKKKIGSSINRAMSPLEATALTLFLLQQKTLNDAFQVSHKKFFENLHQKQMGKWEELRARRDGAAQNIVDPHSSPSMQVRPTAKTDEIKRAVQGAVAKMNPDDLLKLADSSLDTLGIER